MSDLVERAWAGIASALGDAWAWGATEDGSQELLTWLFAVGMPVTAGVMAWVARTMAHQTTIRTRLGTSLIFLFVSLAFFFSAFALLSVNQLATVYHGLYTEDFWWRLTLRVILAVAVIFITVAAVRTTTELRRAMGMFA